MPVVINRSSASGGGSQPDKNGGKKAKGAAKPGTKGRKAKAGGGSLFADQRVKIGALVGLVIIAIVVVMFTMGLFGGGQSAPPVTATPARTAGAGSRGTGAPGSLGAGPSGPGIRPGVSIPGEPGEDSGTTGGAQLPRGSGM